TTQIVFSSHVEAIERWNLLAAVAGNVSHLSVQSNHIALFVDGRKALHFENIGDGVYVAADGTTRKRKRIVKAFALFRLLWIIDRVVLNARRDGAGNDAVERAGACKAAVLDRLEQEL